MSRDEAMSLECGMFVLNSLFWLFIFDLSVPARSSRQPRVLSGKRHSRMRRQSHQDGTM
jgi:hypothetical protein